MTSSLRFCVLLGISLCLCVGSFAQGSKEYVTMEYGTPLVVPADKVATFVSAYFNINNFGGTEFAQVALWGGVQGEVEFMPATALHKLMPTFGVGSSIVKGTEGAPASGESFKFGGGGTFSLVINDQGTLYFDEANMIIRALVLIEDAVVTDCCGTTGSSDNILPLAAVVVHSDATGNVAISLESSSDMVNWVSASPGNYPASTSNKFFRARAELLGP